MANKWPEIPEGYGIPIEVELMEATVLRRVSHGRLIIEKIPFHVQVISFDLLFHEK